MGPGNRTRRSPDETESSRQLDSTGEESVKLRVGTQEENRSADQRSIRQWSPPISGMDWAAHLDFGTTQLADSSVWSVVGLGSFSTLQMVIGELLCSNTYPRYSTKVLCSRRGRRSAGKFISFSLFKVGYSVMSWCGKQHARTRNTTVFYYKRRRLLEQRWRKHHVSHRQ